MRRAHVIDHIVHTHLVLREATARVEGTDDAEEIERALGALGEILPDHFHAEEREDGFFDHLRRSLDGNVEIEVASLADEHRAMERELIDLLGPVLHDAVWVGRGKALARRLQEHETREARLGVAGFESF